MRRRHSFSSSSSITRSAIAVLLPSWHGASRPGGPITTLATRRPRGTRPSGRIPGPLAPAASLRAGQGLKPTARQRSETAMHALVYHGPGRKACEEVPDPEIVDEGDAIVRVDATTICGTDLHIL